MSFPKIVSRVPRLIVPAHAYNMQNVSLSCTNIPDGQTFTIDYGDGTPVQTYSGSRSLTHQFINTTGEDKIYRVELRTDGQSVYEDVLVYSLTALTEVMKQLKDTAFQDVLVMAHRANTSDKSIPENSLVALNAAISAGAHFVETDTHLTSDGVVVICHDKTIDRTTTGSGNIPAMTLAQLRGYNLLDRNGNAWFAGEVTVGENNDTYVKKLSEGDTVDTGYYRFYGVPVNKTGVQLIKGSTWAAASTVVIRNSSKSITVPTPTSDGDAVPYSMYKTLLTRVEALEKKV
jgi:hypothetical protein